MSPYVSIPSSSPACTAVRRASEKVETKLMAIPTPWHTKPIITRVKFVSKGRKATGPSGGNQEI